MDEISLTPGALLQVLVHGTFVVIYVWAYWAWARYFFRAVDPRLRAWVGARLGVSVRLERRRPRPGYHEQFFWVADVGLLMEPVLVLIQLLFWVPAAVGPFAPLFLLLVAGAVQPLVAVLGLLALTWICVRTFFG